jgi:hypothetical protein
LWLEPEAQPLSSNQWRDGKAEPFRSVLRQSRNSFSAKQFN